MESQATTLCCWTAAADLCEWNSKKYGRWVCLAGFRWCLSCWRPSWWRWCTKPSMTPSLVWSWLWTIDVFISCLEDSTTRKCKCCWDCTFWGGWLRGTGLPSSENRNRDSQCSLFWIPSRARWRTAGYCYGQHVQYGDFNECQDVKLSYEEDTGDESPQLQLSKNLLRVEVQVVFADDFGVHKEGEQNHEAELGLGQRGYAMNNV